MAVDRGSGPQPSTPPVGQRPNVLLVVLDQLRYDSVGLTSGGLVRTPNLDALAARGTFFDHAYSHLPSCCPARQSLLTGQRPETMGTLWNYDLGSPIPALAEDAATWSGALSDAGYRSSYFGKWHVHPSLGPEAFGYDRYVTYGEHAQHFHDQHPDLQPTKDWFGEELSAPAADCPPGWFAGQVSQEILRLDAGEDPWHVRLDLIEPHLPCRPATEFAERYRAADVEPWGSFTEDFANKPYIQRQQLINWGIEDWTWDRWAPVVARYRAVIEEVDAAIGQVLATLETAGCRDNTLVIVTTDHGDMCGAHRMMDKHYVLYDDTTRVPLIMAGPGVQAGQRRSEFVYNLLDLGPTILAACDLPPLDGMVGQPLQPLLQDPHPADSWRDHVVLTFNGQQFGLYTQRAIRTKEWKYVWNATDVDELYALGDDPHELVNRALEPATESIRRDLRRALHAELEAFGDRQVLNPWVRHQFVDV